MTKGYFQRNNDKAESEGQEQPGEKLLNIFQFQLLMMVKIRKQFIHTSLVTLMVKMVIILNDIWASLFYRFLPNSTLQ